MNLLPTATIQVPTFIPAGHRAMIANKRVQGKVPRGARMRVRTPENIGSSDWGVKYRNMPRSEANAGPWRNEYIPHAPQIFEEYDKPYVKEIYYCGPERDGKTNIMLTTLGRGQACEPGNFFFMMPNETKAGEVFKYKIKPLFELSKPLRKLLTGKVNDFTVGNVNLANGVLGFPAHATSAPSLATFSGKYLYGDEVDKNDDTVGKETDAITLLIKRMRDQEDGKLFCASTPAGKFIYSLANECVRVYRWEMQCPGCNEYHIATEEGLIIPDGATKETLKRGEHIALQACPKCGSMMDEHQLNTARRNARKVAIKGADIARPESIGILRTAFDCHLIPLKEIAIAKVKADHGGIAEKRDYAHGYKCENYDGESVTIEEDKILLLCDDRPEGIIPSGRDIADLLLTVDTQMNHFWFVLRAFAYGMDQESWLVRCGQLQTFAAIEKMMYETEYLTADGQPHSITAVGIDTGGTKHDGDDHSRTYEVYDWARRHPMVYPFKGAKRGAKPHTATKLDFFPDGKPLPGGMLLRNVNTNYYKDELFRRLNIAPDLEGAMHLHSGFPGPHLELSIEKRPPSNLKEYARHICGERRTEAAVWEKIGSRRHDLWDCEYMQIALADILGTRYMKKPTQQTATPIKKASKPKQQQSGRW